MEEKGKGFSLRQKKSSRRPPISAPKQISSQGAPAPRGNRANGTSEASASTDLERPKVGGNTSDLVKRRYSTRFTTLPDFSNADAPPMPALPGDPQSLQQRPQAAPTSSQKITVDLAALRVKGLQAEQYSSQILSEASDQELRDYQASLRKIKNRTSTDLQQNVYQNRTQFIKISKEVEKLKGEMRTLRGLMSELTSSLSQASVGSAASEVRSSQDNGVTRARKQANRSSVANLEAMWNSQLHALWQNVEGSQKFLPAIPSRHVVHEQGYWVELDAATWKAKRPAHIFLLNDHLMIATRKKKRVDPNALVNGDAEKRVATKLIADKCWSLQDIDMVDLAPASASSGANSAGERREMANAISVRHGHESFTYRSDRSSSTEKGNLLLAFRRAADELRRTVGTDGGTVDSKSKETMTYLATRDPALSSNTGLLKSLSDAKDRPELLVDVDGKQKNLRWVEGQIDELDIEIALQRFEDAVRYVEKLRKLVKGLKGNMVAHDLITTRVNERAGKLAELVTQRLVETHSGVKATQTNVAWLVRLGFDDLAREAYLKARSGVIAQRARQCVFEGDLHHYILEISYVYFTLLKNTVSNYQHCFPPLMMSACVKWAKEHLDGFNVILARQLSSVQRDSPTWKQCLDGARNNAQMMDKVGVDFKNLVGSALENDGENDATVADAGSQ